MRNWLALVFDLDDTLYPERDYVLSGFRAVADWCGERLGLSPEAGRAALGRLFAAGVRGDTFDRWLREAGLDPTPWVPQLVAVYRDHSPTLAPFPNVPPLLERLRGHYRLGLLSDGYLAVQQRKLAVLGLAPYFSATVFSDELGRAAWKPSPRPFELLLERLGVAAADAIYLADNPAKDFLGARRAGLASIRVRRPDGIYSRAEPATPDHAPDWEVADLAAALTLIESAGQAR